MGILKYKCLNCEAWVEYEDTGGDLRDFCGYACKSTYYQLHKPVRYWENMEKLYVVK